MSGTPDKATIKRPSKRWSTLDNLQNFARQPRLFQAESGPDDWAKRPVIGVLNGQSDLNPWSMHYKRPVADVTSRVLQAGGRPVGLLAIAALESVISHVMPAKQITARLQLSRPEFGPLIVNRTLSDSCD